jgi:hypothetical protein
MLALAAIVAILAACNPAPNPTPDPEPPTDVAVEPDSGDPRGAVGTLRVNQIRTRHLFDGSVTSGKLAIKAATVTVLAAAATGSSAADATLEGGFLVGCHPASNQDQHVDNVVLNANGSITVTLAANATANNVFSCKAIKANAKGIN